jgi:hypothetical protein
MIQQNEATVQARRLRAELVICPHCHQLIVQDAFCSACGSVFDMQGLVDMLVANKAMKPPVVDFQA